MAIFRNDDPEGTPPDPKDEARAIPLLPLRDIVVFPTMVVPLFVGRVPVVATLEELDESALIDILTEPKNALTKQYQKLFEFEDVRLRFTDGALRAVARQALVRKSGARGLRAILETAMLDLMYEIPSRDDLEECVFGEEMIEQGAEPLLVYKQEAESA